jgi:uncharacterized protein (TIGR02300 family)
LANPELGQKLICPVDQTKFYDLNRRPAVCPKCGNAFDPEEVLKSRRVRTRVPDYEDDAEKEVKAAVADDEELEEEETTPEIDAAADEPVLADDEDEGDAEPGVVAPPADDIGVDFAEEEDLAEDGEDVPFLEDEEEDDFADADIEVPDDEDERGR